VPAPIHAGGLRYHGMAPLVSQGIVEGLLEPLALNQTECYEAAILWACTEGSISAPETSHAIAAAIRQAKQAKEEGKEKVILLNWSGHGLMDLNGYQSYMEGKLTDYALPEADLQKSIKVLNDMPKPSLAKSGKW
jgi:tryptophan synthase beta chain